MNLKVKNYQAHRDSELDLISPGINVIVGESDCGKSSLIRAVEALADNGVMDRRHGSKETSVDLDGCCRVRSSSKNQFEVEGRVYKAMRSEVPREIADRLNLSPVNFRSQHSPYFLIGDSPGAVARAMNEFADLGLIDFVVQRLKKEAKDADDDVKRLEKDRDTITGQIKALDWAVAADRDWGVIEGKYELESGLKKMWGIRAELLTQVVAAEQRLAQFPTLTVAELREAAERLTATETTAETLARLLTETRKLTETLSALPPDLLPEVRRVSDRVNGIVDPEPLQRVLSTIRELDYELELCPDIQQTLAQLNAVEIPDPTGLELILSSLASLPSIPDTTLGRGCLELLAERVSSIEFWEERQEKLRALLYAEREESLALTDIGFTLEKRRAELEDMLHELGVCPFCDRAFEEAV